MMETKYTLRKIISTNTQRFVLDLPFKTPFGSELKTKPHYVIQGTSSQFGKKELDITYQIQKYYEHLKTALDATFSNPDERAEIVKSMVERVTPLVSLGSRCIENEALKIALGVVVSYSEVQCGVAISNSKKVLQKVLDHYQVKKCEQEKCMLTLEKTFKENFSADIGTIFNDSGAFNMLCGGILSLFSEKKV